MGQSRTYKAAVLATGHFLATFTVLVGYMVLSRLFSKEDYATYRQTMLAYNFVVPLLLLGLPQGLYYFLPVEKKRPRGVLLENIVPLAGLGMVFAAFLFFGGNRWLAQWFHNPALVKTLVLLSPYPIFMLPVASFASCLTVMNRTRHLAIFNVIRSVLTIGMIIVAAMIWKTPTAVIAATVLAAGIMLLPAVKLMFDATGNVATNTTGSIGNKITDNNATGNIATDNDSCNAGFTWSGMLNQLRFSVPLGLASMVGVIALGLDKVIVSSMCTAQQFAIYVNGAIEIPLVAIITGSITSVLLGDLRRCYSEDNKREALAIWQRSAVKAALVLLPVMAFLMFKAPEVLTLLFSSKYAESAGPFRIYLLLLPISTAFFSAMIIAAGKSKLILIRSTVSFFMNLALSVTLVYVMGYMGAAIATVITMYLWMVPFCIWVISRSYNTKMTEIFPLRGIAKVGFYAYAACVVFIPVYRITSNMVVNFVISSVCYAIAVMLLFHYSKLINIKELRNVIIKRLKGISISNN